MRLFRRLFSIGLLVSIAACATTPPASQKFPVFFQEWSAALDDAAIKTIGVAAKWATDHPGEAVHVAGFADPEGSQEANKAISRTRAQVVLDQLVRDGVARSRISLSARGPTDYTLSSIESRRVEVSIGG